MEKFTTTPFGLGLYHIEHEETAAYIWNQLVDENLSPDSLFDPSPVRLKNMHFDPGSGNAVELGVVEQVGDKYRLTDFAIEKIKAYFENRMHRFYFTCGQVHQHVIEGKVWNKDSVLQVKAKSEEAARDEVFSRVGDKWSMCYVPAEMDLEFFPNGICCEITAK